MPAPHTSELRHFKKVAEAQNNFYQDRPSVLRFNRQGQNDVSLLATEVEELQGEPEYGLSLEDYRAQELSDVWLFARNMLSRLHSEVDEQYIFRRCLQLIGTVSPAPEQEVSQLENVYQDILSRLNALMQELKECCSAGKESAQLITGLQEIVAHTTALFFLIGKEPVDSCMEKIARNMLKYEAHELPAKIDYAEVSPRIKASWKQQNGDQKFFAPLERGQAIRERNNVPLSPRSTRQEWSMLLKDYWLQIPQAFLAAEKQVGEYVEEVERQYTWRDIPRGVRFASVRVAKGIGNRLR